MSYYSNKDWTRVYKVKFNVADIFSTRYIVEILTVSLLTPSNWKVTIPLLLQRNNFQSFKSLEMALRL